MNQLLPDLLPVHITNQTSCPNRLSDNWINDIHPGLIWKGMFTGDILRRRAIGVGISHWHIPELAV